MPPENAAQWTSAAVAARLGVATTTLRTWSRRYGIGPVDHMPGRHRRYTAADVSQLEALCALVAGGLAPASAAELIRSGTTLTSSPQPAESQTRPAAVDAKAAVRGLLSAVLRLDADTVARAVGHHIDTGGVVQTWDTLCVPVLVELGRRTATGDCIETEHLFSVTLSAVLHRVTGPAPSATHRGALLSCAPGERHTLALEALHAALTERGAAARSLGPDLPTTALIDAVRRTRPAVVALWAQTQPTARVTALDHLRALHTATVLALGPGWARRRLPRGVLIADTLPAALHLILQAQPEITTAPIKLTLSNKR